MQVDATEDANKALATKFGIQGFPTLKVKMPLDPVLICRQPSDTGNFCWKPAIPLNVIIWEFPESWLVADADL